MGAADIGEIVSRKVLIEDDVANQRRAPVQALEQIVADECVLRHTPLQVMMEGRDIIGPLANEYPFAEQILIDVGDRAAIDVNCRVAGIEAGEQRADPRARRDLHPRLDKRITSARSS